MPRSWHENPAPHRVINHGDRGEDVRRWQQGMNHRAKARGWSDRTRPDGVAGPDSFVLWRKVRYAIGLPEGHPPTKAAQANTRWPWTRSPAAVARAQRRKRWRPRIVTARQMGLSFSNLFGPLGPEDDVTGHHTAGSIPDTLQGEIALHRVYHNGHAGNGWGGMGYHVGLGRRGEILCLRPTALKGAHVGGWNSRNYGITCHGTTGDRPTPEQARSLEWLLANAHTRRMPAAHRTDRDLRQSGRHGHNDWPGHESNACPGTHKPMYLSGGDAR